MMNSFEFLQKEFRQFVRTYISQSCKVFKRVEFLKFAKGSTEVAFSS